MSFPLLDEPLGRICVFRALMLGDLLCAVPALRALRGAFPSARIALIGLPWAYSLAERLACIDEVIEFPGYPGLPESVYRPGALRGFLAYMRGQRFDLALQLHGSGGVTNPLVALAGARQSAGFFDSPALVPAADRQRYLRWPESGHEIERLLTLTDRLALPRRGVHLEFPINDADRSSLRRLCPRLHDGWPYVCLHAGAHLPSRRWAPERFAAVADALAEQGFRIVLTGTAAERPLAAQVAGAMRAPSITLVGQTSLWTLGALLEGAALLVANDTGVSQIAAALGTPSVIVSCGADVERWAPLDARRHRVLWVPMTCRPCRHVMCCECHGCAEAIGVAEVLDVAHAVLAECGSRIPAGLSS